MSQRQLAQESENLSAYEAAAASDDLDPRCVPIRLDSPAPEGETIAYPEYSLTDHETWSMLYSRQRRLLPAKACDEYLEGLVLMAFPDDRIPSLARASKTLRDITDWRVARVPGLLHEEQFFEFLSRRVFPSTDYIRPREEMDYTPAPDMFHDVFGHMPMITNPTFADFYQRIGEAALRAKGHDRRRLERFYWFTVEFGLIDTDQGTRIYGNGILSSFKEAQHSLTDAVEKRAFDPDQIVEQEYDVWHMQPVLYEIDSFDQLADGFEKWAKQRRLL